MVDGSVVPVRRLSFLGTGGTLFGIYIVNLLLSVITIGTYSFWGRTRVRQYLLSHTEFEGDRLAYHGTGRELFIGWLKALLIFGAPLFVVSLVVGLSRAPTLQILSSIIVWIALVCIVPIAMVGSRRYRFSRASWRGIRFSFRGRAREFVRLWIPGLLATVFTLGLYSPFFWTNVRKFLVEHVYFGNQRVTFDGQGRDLFGRFLLAIVLSVITLGIYWFWFAAERQRYYWAHTTFSTARFHSTVSGGGLLGLGLTNLLLVIVTLGLALPWVIVRTVNYVTGHLTLEGPLDLAAIHQEAQAASATGEGLAEFFNLEFFDFDLGI